MTEQGTAPKGRGRPAIGKKVQVRLSDTQRAFAARLGGGVESEGVRVALDAVMQRPDLVEAVLEAARSR